MSSMRDFDVIAKMEAFCLAGHRMAYQIITQQTYGDGKVTITDRYNRPCYGEMRSYKKKSRNRPDDPFPGDLENNFPAGTPIGASFCIDHKMSSNSDKHNAFVRWLFSKESPYASAMGEGDDIIYFYKGAFIWGVGILHADFPPTVMVALWMYIRYCQINNWLPIHKCDLWFDLVQKGANPLAAFAAANTVCFNGQHANVPIYGQTGYYMTDYLDLARLFERKPHDLDRGEFWSHRTDYNRPEIQDLFLGKTGDSLQSKVAKAFPELQKSFDSTDLPTVMLPVCEFLIKQAA
jgi:hypothetical protein